MTRVILHLETILGDVYISNSYYSINNIFKCVYILMLYILKLNFFTVFQIVVGTYHFILLFIDVYS